VTLHRSLDLAPEFVTIRHGIPVTKPLRLLVDLGAVVPWHLVSRALEQLVTRRVVTVAGARAARDQLGRRGRSGTGVLGHVLDRRALREVRAESVLEAAFAELCVRFDLPVPEYQYRLIVGGEARRIDFAFPDLKVAIEVDGYAYHREWDAFQDERIRGNALELEGWLVLRFTWEQVIRRPDEVARTVRRALRQRATAPAA
jgi:very-short-patch-repair endonuclease